jgi:hypothetical protein
MIQCSCFSTRAALSSSDCLSLWCAAKQEHRSERENLILPKFSEPLTVAKRSHSWRFKSQAWSFAGGRFQKRGLNCFKSRKFSKAMTFWAKSPLLFLLVNFFDQTRLLISRIEMTRLEAEIVRLYFQGHAQAMIARALKTSKTRMSRTIRFSKATQTIPVALKDGRQRKISSGRDDGFCGCAFPSRGHVFGVTNRIYCASRMVIRFPEYWTDCSKSWLDSLRWGSLALNDDTAPERSEGKRISTKKVKLDSLHKNDFLNWYVASAVQKASRGSRFPVPV